MKPDDLKIEAWPPRHKGGMQVVLHRSGIKITHIPSGIEAAVFVGGSQQVSRVIALNMIEAALTHPDFPAQEGE